MRDSGVKTENNQDMQCNEAELRIIDLLASGSQEQVSTDLSEHMHACNSCSRFFKECSTGFSGIAEGRKITSDPDFYEKIAGALQQKESTGHRRLPARRILRYSPTIVAAAASVLLGIWIGSRLISPAQSGFSNGSFSSGAGGNSLIQNYDSDLHPEDETTSILVGYLTEIENTDSYDTE
ncbi:MAG: hypothetical protein IPN08_03940 [Bacteroidales bacterium]|nr:hypothetical protein [Bacteroidales bacterium]MBK9356533.1 hypothetical protein [Bacteroidales bacterium]